MMQKDEVIKKGIKIIDSKERHNALFENLKTHFPQTIRDNQVDLKTITTLLGLDTNTNIQGYELTFTGKALANALYSTPTQKMLKLEETFTYHNLESCKHSKESKNTENEEDSNAEAQNFIIKGDNLDALKILKSAYSEKIKMIYIDPPYNTTNDNFIYPDNFRKDYKAILQEVGLLEIDDEGNEIESETLQFFKNIQSTRTHSGWLSFMLPRLKLARDLLREDGVIFISIDDNEQANLKILCDEIFGEENFVSTLIWRKIEENSSSGGTMKITKNFRKDHEFIVCYAKNYDLFLTNKFLELPNFENEYKNLDNDPRGEFKAGSISMKGTKNSSKYYEIETPSGKKYSRVWRITKEEFQLLDKDNRIYYGKNRDSVPQIKIFINEERPVTPTSFFENLGSSFSAGEELNKIFKNDKDDNIFSNPKPINLIKRICEISTNAEENDIILDFFAGSGTTAQAVMELNAEDNGNRKFILVQLDEKIDKKKSKVAYDFCKNTLKSKSPVISDITIERVKRASAKIANANPDFNIHFNVLSLSDKPELITTEQGTLELISNLNLNPFDKALHLALQSGKTLDKPLKSIFANKLYQCEDCLYLVTCDKEVLDFLRNTQNEYIFIDGFEDLSLENFLNLDSSLSDRLRIVY
ncbi:site-specific DNA-methyltransferase [Helicobacter sp. WB40]|uniref:site-specific DNA-methyltransferase n=1 Tax=Helicobacter sp. WB40 TaxID=3004130 RepID=UPI0022EC009B|nr:site-specific DNA-methyltransferase [Helicobacter sp. WB40]MDA3967903.1 site-specific DNA-methyltransferase [Helicobacter sp. WB40]